MITGPKQFSKRSASNVQISQQTSSTLMHDTASSKQLDTVKNVTPVKTTQVQWYLKTPSKLKHSFYDESYKAVPSLNQGQRTMKLNQISKDNLKMFERLQSVRSDYNATDLLEQMHKQHIHKQRIKLYDSSGKPRKDPLEERLKTHSLHSMSKNRLSSLRSLNNGSSKGNSPDARSSERHKKKAVMTTQASGEGLPGIGKRTQRYHEHSNNDDMAQEM